MSRHDERGRLNLYTSIMIQLFVGDIHKMYTF